MLVVAGSGSVPLRQRSYGHMYSPCHRSPQVLDTLVLQHGLLMVYLMRFFNFKVGLQRMVQNWIDEDAELVWSDLDCGAHCRRLGVHVTHRTIISAALTLDFERYPWRTRLGWLLLTLLIIVMRSSVGVQGWDMRYVIATHTSGWTLPAFEVSWYGPM